MKCPACGAEVEEISVYCPKCGERVESPDEEMPSPGEAREPEPASEEFPPEEPPPPASETPPPKRPAETLRESVQARQETDDDEELELWKGRYSKRTFVGTWLLCGLITAALLFIGIMWVRTAVLWLILLVAILVTWGYPFLLLSYRRMSIRYRLTSQRFFHEKGILRHVTDRIEVIDIDDIKYDQTLLQRLVNVGTIHITSSDRSDPMLHVLGVENVKEIASMMDNARRKERIRRGLHIEAV
jgi:membrane protein YdbS with pleckstrin-like domain